MSIVTEKKEKQYICDNAQLMAEWNWEKNTEISPFSTTLGSGKKVWWKCSRDHEWIADVNSRKKGNGCPVCAGKRVLIGYNDLATTHPQIAEEWHPTKNGDLTAFDVTAGSKKTVWWKCSNGHEWDSVVNSRTNRNRGCPICSVSVGTNKSNNTRVATRGSLKSLRPDLVLEWHPTKNKGILPSDVTLGSDKKVWWICDHGHEWECAIRFRTKKNYGCPFCSGKQVLTGFNDLETTNPKLALEWNPTRNGTTKPSTILPGSNKKAWWLCKNGHEWQAVINSRTQGRQCPICSEGRQTSFQELAFYYYLKKHYVDAISRANINGVEFDIFLPSINVAIEYDGQFYHTNVERDLAKDTFAIENGFRLIRIREPKCPPVNCNETIIIQREALSTADFNRCMKELEQTLSILTGNSIVSVNIDLDRDTNEILSIIWLSSKANSLMVSNPVLAKQWHPHKNGSLTPDKVLPGSTKKVWWICDEGHEWLAEINSRNRGRKCPICYHNKRSKK